MVDAKTICRKRIFSFTKKQFGLINRVKEWTYAGFAIVFISASTAHIAVEGISAAIAPVIQLLVLFTSYVYSNKLNKTDELTM